MQVSRREFRKLECQVLSGYVDGAFEPNGTAFSATFWNFHKR